MLLGNPTLKPQSSLCFETFSLHLHHHLSDLGSFNLFSTLQPKRAFKRQISSGHFPAQKCLENYYYSQDQVQPSTSDPPPSEAYPPGEPGFHLTHISRHTAQFPGSQRPPQGHRQLILSTQNGFLPHTPTFVQLVPYRTPLCHFYFY